MSGREGSIRKEALVVNNRDDSMHIDSISVGDRFIKVDLPRWRDSIHSERPVEVVRTMKSRLALAIINDDGERTARGMRIIVRDGLVSHREEGSSKYGNPVYLYSEDDPILATLRTRTQHVQTRWSARDAAERAHKNLEPKTARAAIEALQAYLDSDTTED